jgi:hypothetical protein
MPNSACCSTKTRKKDTIYFVDRHRRVWATDVNLMIKGGGWEGAPGSASVPRQTLRVATTLDTIRFSLGLEEQRLLTRFTGYKPTSQCDTLHPERGELVVVIHTATESSNSENFEMAQYRPCLSAAIYSRRRDHFEQNILTTFPGTLHEYIQEKSYITMGQ